MDEYRDAFFVVENESKISMYSAINGDLIGEKIDVGAPMTCASINWEGSELLTASAHGVAQLWNVDDGERIGRPMQHHFGVKSVETSKDGRRVLSVSNDGTVRLWNISRNKSRHSPGSNWASVAHVLYRQDNRAAVIIDVNGNSQLIDGTTSRPIGGNLFHAGKINHVAFQGDGGSVVTFSNDDAIRTWETETGALAGEHSINRDADVDILDVRFLCDGTRLLIRMSNQKIHLIDVKTGLSLCDPFNDHMFSEIVCSQDGRQFLTRVRKSNSLQIWSAAGGEHLKEIKLHEDYEADVSIVSAGFSKDGERLIVSLVGGVFQCWDVSSGQRTQFQVTRKRDDEWHWYREPVFRHDRSRALVTTPRGELELWDCKSGKLVKKVLDEGGKLNRLEYRADGAQFFSISNGRSLQVWDGDTGEPYGMEMLHDGRIIDACFIGINRSLITISGDNSVNMWDLMTGELSNQFDFDSKILRMFSSSYGDKFLVQTLAGNLVFLDF